MQKTETKHSMKRKSRGWAIADPYANMMADLSVAKGKRPGELVEELVKQEIERRLKNDPEFADRLMLAARSRQRDPEADLDYRDLLDLD